MLEENRWQMQRHQLEELLENPGVVQWWRADLKGSGFLGPEFTALVEEILGEEPDRGK